MRITSLLRLAITLLVTLSLLNITSSCSQHALVDENRNKVDLVWPDYPEVQRIRYISSISSAEDIDIKPSLFMSILYFIKGEVQRNIVRPFGIRKDAEGRIYVVDKYYRRVHVFDKKNTTHYMFPADPIDEFNNPVDVAIGMNGQIYVSDSESNRIHVFSSAGKKYIRSFGADILKRPTGMAVDSINNRLLVTDTLASSIVVFGEKDFNVIEIIGDESKGMNGFHYPTNVAISNDGRIYVTDSLNFRIQIIDNEYHFTQAFGSAGDGPGHFSRPKGIAIDSEGNVYVVDALFGNVQIFDPSGKLLLSFGRPGNDRGEFWLPNSIFIDSDDRIYISDSYNSRLQVFQYLPYGDNKL